jgi:hypothetical protein
MPRRLMPTLLPFAALLGLIALLPAQEPSQPDLVRQRDARLGKAAFQQANWLRDYDEAVALAGKQKKPILAYFTTSVAPNPQCDAVEDGLLMDPGFAAIARDFVLFVHCTSRIEGEKHASLLHKKGLAILPTLCFLGPDGTMITPVRPQELAVLRATGDKVRALVAAQGDLAANGGTSAEKALFRAELELGRIQADQLPERLTRAAFTAAERAAIDPLIVDVEITAIARKTTDQNRQELAAQVAAMHRAGRQPTAATAFPFWGYLLHHAAKTKDAKLADDAFANLVALQSTTKELIRNLAAQEKWKKLVDEAKQQ